MLKNNYIILNGFIHLYKVTKFYYLFIYSIIYLSIFQNIKNRVIFLQNIKKVLKGLGCKYVVKLKTKVS